MTPLNRGPFLVIDHIDNNVLVRNLISGANFELNQNHVMAFIGSAEDAFNMAQLDNDQFLVKSITAYNGNPDKRSTMDFLVTYADGQQLWVPFSLDLFQTIPFEEYYFKQWDSTSRLSLVHRYKLLVSDE